MPLLLSNDKRRQRTKRGRGLTSPCRLGGRAVLLVPHTLLVSSDPNLGDLLPVLIQRNVPGTSSGMEEVLKLILDVRIESRALIWFRP